MTSTVNPPLMSGDDIVALIESMEVKLSSSGEHRYDHRRISDYAYAINQFPDDIRRKIVERIVLNGAHEAIAIRSAIMLNKNGYRSIAIYLNTVDAFIAINACDDHGRSAAPFETAQYEIGEYAAELGVDRVRDSRLEPRHYELVIAAHLMRKFGIDKSFPLVHDYHVQLELLRSNLSAIMENIAVVLPVGKDAHVPSASVASVAVCLGRNPHFDPERLLAVIDERGGFEPEIIDIMADDGPVPLDSGVL